MACEVVGQARSICARTLGYANNLVNSGTSSFRGRAREEGRLGGEEVHGLNFKCKSSRKTGWKAELKRERKLRNDVFEEMEGGLESKFPSQTESSSSMDIISHQAALVLEVRKERGSGQ